MICDSLALFSFFAIGRLLTFSSTLANSYPKELHEKAFAAGLGGLIYPPELGGTRPADFDPFYELIMIDEMSRMGGGAVMGQGAINSMALPPIIHYGSDELKAKYVKDVVQGRKFACLGKFVSFFCLYLYFLKTCLIDF